MSAPFTKLPGWVEYGVIPLANLIVAFLISGLVVLFVGENPLRAAYLMVSGAFGYGEGIGFTLYYATNFIFTGLSVAVAFHAGLFNIGSEGQAYVSGIGVAIVCLMLDRVAPWFITFPIAMLAGAMFGALWAFLPGWLQAYRGSHVVITTIMFNYIATSLMLYMLNKVFKPMGSMALQTRTFEEGAQVPKLGWLLGMFGLEIRNAPFNITFLLALMACVAVFYLIWRTKLGYELRTMGFQPKSAVYAGNKIRRLVVIAMVISGGLAGLMSLNSIMGEQYRMQLDFVAGAGFVGIAVALMGRNHPLGIIPAAILFGMLYQGGAEISFEMPNISRDMIDIIQGLVILFAGALEHMFRPQITAAYVALFARNAQQGSLSAMDLYTILISVLESTIRMSVPLIFAGLAGMFTERAGVFDIGLEGKMLAAAFAGGAAAAVAGDVWIGLLAAMAVSVALALVHGFASITERGNQIVSGLAINFVAFGTTIIIGQAWFQQGGRTPALTEGARFTPITLPFSDEIREIPFIGPLYAQIIGGQYLLAYVAFLMVPISWWILYRTRFGLRLRAVGENPGAVDTAGISVVRMRYWGVICAGILCGLAGAYLALCLNGGFVKGMTAGKGYVALAALIFARWRPVPLMWACLLFGFLDAVAIQIQGKSLPIVGQVSVQFIQALPYVPTVILLAGFIGKAIPPKAGGVPYVKER